jgi:hypothetical protein
VAVRCSQLIKVDLLSKSDARVCLFTKSETGNDAVFKFHSQTETRENTHDPIFETKFLVEMHPDTALSWRVFDDADPETDEMRQMGGMANTLLEVLNDPGRQYQLRHAFDAKRDAKLLKSKANISMSAKLLTLVPVEALKHAEDAGLGLEELEMMLAARNLPTLPGRNRVDAIVKASRRGAGGKKWKEISMTEELKDSRSPDWKTGVKLSGDDSQEVRFEVYDADRGQCHARGLIGYAIVKMTDMLHGANLTLQLKSDDTELAEILKNKDAHLLVASKKGGKTGKSVHFNTVYNPAMFYDKITVAAVVRLGNVPSMRLFGTSELRVALHVKHPSHYSFEYAGETEKDFVFKEKLWAVNMDKDSLLRFTVVDKKDGTCRSDEEKLSQRNKVGSLELTVHELLTNPHRVWYLTHNLRGNRDAKLKRAKANIAFGVNVLELVEAELEEVQHTNTLIQHMALHLYYALVWCWHYPYLFRAYLHTDIVLSKEKPDYRHLTDTV